MPAPPPASDAKAQRLARALRDNLRRRKAGGAAIEPEAPSRVADGAPGDERLYPPHPGAPGDD